MLALTCVRRSSAKVSLPARREHFTWRSRPVPNAMLALYCMPGLRCCFDECIAMCAWRAHVCILSCGVLLMLARLCRFSLTTVAGLHVAMPFEWCVQAFPSGHVGPPATAGNKRRFGKGLHKRRRWHGQSSSQEVEVYLGGV